MNRTLLAEWAYASRFNDTAERIAALPAYLDPLGSREELVLPIPR